MKIRLAWVADAPHEQGHAGKRLLATAAVALPLNLIGTGKTNGEASEKKETANGARGACQIGHPHRGTNGERLNRHRLANL